VIATASRRAARRLAVPGGADPLALDLAAALDAVAFGRRCGLVLDPWQEEAARSPEQQLILLAGRQSGKSTVSSILALHTALYRPGSLVLLLSPSLRQSGELFRKVRSALSAYRGAAGDEDGLVVEENALRLGFANGSGIVCLPGKEGTIRGFSSVSLLIVDEASRVSDALYFSVRPMLAVSGGRIVLLSTPAGRRGFFFQEWEEGGAGWHRIRVTADQIPRISPAWLAEERATVGEWWFAQEYMTVFQEAEDQLFGYEELKDMLDDADVTPFPTGEVGEAKAAEAGGAAACPVDEWRGWPG
jgi:hypothetical protein